MNSVRGLSTNSFEGTSSNLPKLSSYITLPGGTVLAPLTNRTTIGTLSENVNSSQIKNEVAPS
jgi:hypothetical protein